LEETEQSRSKGDRRSAQYQIKNKQMRGLEDYLGRDIMYKTIEIITEYRPDRWVTICPRLGTVIRDIPNPYRHGEIPVVHLKYYPLPDDIYGVSEYEPVSKLIRGINSLFSQYVDNIAVDLYPPLMVNPINVRMHTLEFTPEAKWLMNNPGVDVKKLETSTAASQNFQSAYQIMVGSLLNAWGEASQGYSQVNPTQDRGKVTATEIKDTAFTRNVRDNMNQIFLADALKKQIMFWHSLNQQYLFSGKSEKLKIIRIVGKDAVEYFNRMGLSDIQPTHDIAMKMASGDITTPVQEGPTFPVADQKGNIVSKFVPDQMGGGGNLYIEPGDLLGTYDYIPDIESMKAPTDENVEQKLTAILATITNPAILQMLASENKKPKVLELLVKMFEATKVIKDADAYFEDIPQPTPQLGGNNAQGQIGPGGGASTEAGIPPQGNGGNTGMVQRVAPVAPRQNTQLMGGPPQF